MIKRALFLGSKKFGLELLKTLINANKKICWAIASPPNSEDTGGRISDFDALSKEKGFNFTVVKSSEETAHYARTNQVDIMIVCGYYRILPKELINIIPQGVWGIHNSLLPKYRGGSPLVWQIINGEKYLGSSFFQFNEYVDAGPVLAQIRIPNIPVKSIDQALNFLENKWIKELPKHWNNICTGNAKPIQQEHSDATYCAQRFELDGQLDWNKNAFYIDCFIKAQMSPYPKAFFFLDNKKILVEQHETDDRIVYGTNGQVFEIKKSYVSICCGGNTIIKLKKLQVNGRILQAREVFSSIKQRIKFNYKKS